MVYGLGTSFDFDWLFEHGEIPCVLPLAVHLDLEHIPNILRYFLSEPWPIDLSDSPEAKFPFPPGFDWDWEWNLAWGLSIPRNEFKTE